MLNPEFKAKWVAALRSGVYVQARNALRSWDNKYCCLGVACDLFDQKAWVNLSESSVFTDSEWAVNDDGEADSSGTLPSNIIDAIGLPRIEETELIHMNDTNHDDFNKIADYIEKNL